MSMLGAMEQEARVGRIEAAEVNLVLDQVFHMHKFGVLELDAIRQRLGLGRAYDKDRS